MSLEKSNRSQLFCYDDLHEPLSRSFRISSPHCRLTLRLGGIHRVGGSQSFVRASAGDVIVRGRYMEMTSHIWIGWRTQQQQPGVEACSEPKKVAAVILNTRDYYYYYKMYRLENLE